MPFPYCVHMSIAFCYCQRYCFLFLFTQNKKKRKGQYQEDNHLWLVEKTMVGTKVRNRPMDSYTHINLKAFKSHPQKRFCI